MRETSSILKINLPSIRNSCLKNHKVGLTLNIKADVAFCNILVGHLWKPCLEHVQHSAELGTKNQWRWRNCAYNDLLHTFYKLYRIYIYTHTQGSVETESYKCSCHYAFTWHKTNSAERIHHIQNVHFSPLSAHKSYVWQRKTALNGSNTLFSSTPSMVHTMSNN